VKSTETIRRWVRELKAEPSHPNMEAYRQGAIMALECILYGWPAPKRFLSVGNKVVVCYCKKRKLIQRRSKEETR